MQVPQVAMVILVDDKRLPLEGETTMWKRLTLEGEMCWVTSVR